MYRDIAKRLYKSKYTNIVEKELRHLNVTSIGYLKSGVSMLHLLTLGCQLVLRLSLPHAI